VRAPRSRYGEGPLHLLAVVASFAIVAYAFGEIVDRPGALSFVVWFGGAAVAHDLIAFPLYSLFGLVAGRAAADRAPAAVNYVRVPALLSAFAFVVWFPFILGLSGEAYEAASGLSTDPFLGRWLLLTAALFAGSGIVYAVTLRRRSRLRGSRSGC
jgi:hypothetical protein